MMDLIRTNDVAIRQSNTRSKRGAEDRVAFAMAGTTDGKIDPAVVTNGAGIGERSGQG